MYLCAQAIEHKCKQIFKALGRIEIGIVIQLYAEKGKEQYLGVASLEGLCSLLFVLIIIMPGKIDSLSL